MKLNRKWLMVIALVLSLTMATAGTLAYLTDSDKDVNTMTLGRVEIVQNEQERTRTEDGELDELDEFTQDKPLLPAYFKGNSIPWADEDEWPVPGDQAWKVVEDNEGVIDKFVTVTNTGKTDAYVRTIIAYEGDETYGPEGAYIHVVHNATNVDPDIKVKCMGTYTIDRVKYTVYVYTYPEVLAADETTIPSLKQVYMDKSATNKVVEQYGATYDILVLSQAMQAQGFNDAETALNEGFGEVTRANLIAWWDETGIGSPGEKNDTNNPPEAKLPTTSWLDNSDTSWYDASKNEYSISTAAELAGLSKLVNEQGVTFRGKTVTLTNSVDLGDHLWTPVGQTGAAQFGGTFDGGNNTISNLYVDSTSKTAKNYSSGLFGWLNTATVKNVKVDGAVINANKYAGVIAGYMESISACTISNCSVRDAKITAVHTNDDNCGDKIGVIVGYAGNAGSVVENCSATKCTVAAGRDAGQIAGAARTEVVTGCTATNVTVSATEGCTGANINEDIIGRKLN